MKVTVKLYNQTIFEFENVSYISKTNEGINIFGNSIEWINIVMQDLSVEKIINNIIEHIQITEF